jgi:hypothetical protein
MKRAAISLALLLCGCITNPTARPSRHSMQTVFIPETHDAFMKEGTSTVSGQAFVKTMGGDVKHGAGNEVFLYPSTPYSLEWLEHAALQGEEVANLDPRFGNYSRRQIGDAEGRFRFERIPPGKYLILCLIQWEVPWFSGSSSGTRTTGGFAISRVVVENGKNVEGAVVTR